MRRAEMTTAAPSRASRSAVARPMPADAPVMATMCCEDMLETAYSFQPSAFSRESAAIEVPIIHSRARCSSGRT